MLWPGRWGDTKATSSPLDSTSPISPGRRPHWLNPAALTGARGPRHARAPPARPPRRPERQRAPRAATGSSSPTTAPPEATALVVAAAPAGPDEPARTAPSRSTHARGEVELPADERDYDVWASVVGADGAASEGVKAQ